MLTTSVLPALVALLAVQETWGLPTSMKTMVLFTDKRTWNSARLICQLTGGQLLSVRDDAEMATVTTFMEQQPWKGQHSFRSSFFWTGLHKVPGSNDARFYWDNCTEAGSYDFESNCVGVRAGSYTHAYLSDYSHTCLSQTKFICEYVGGECQYSSEASTRARDPAPVNVTADNADSCTGHCSRALNNTVECWAVTWTAASRRCELHFAPNSAYYADSANRQHSPGSTLYTKFCYQVSIDNTAFPGYSIGGMESIQPCNQTSSEQKAVVYTLLATPMTWQAARDTCRRMGQELFASDDFADYDDLYDLFGTSVADFWIGASGADANFQWVTGQPVTWNQWNIGEPIASAQKTCVSSRTSSRTWFATSCDQSLPYVCQLTNVSCEYELLANKRGPSIDVRRNVNIKQCYDYCVAESECKGFSFRDTVFSKRCYIHISNDPRYLYDSSNWSNDERFNIYRWTCVFGINTATVPLGKKAEPITGTQITNNITVTSSSVQTVSTSSVLTTSPSSVTHSSVYNTDIFSSEYIAPNSADVYLSPSSSIRDGLTTSGADHPVSSSLNDSQTYVQDFQTTLISVSSGFVPSSILSSENAISSTHLAMSSSTPVASFPTSFASLNASLSTSGSLDNIRITTTYAGAPATPSYSSTSCPCRCKTNLTVEQTDDIIEQIKQALVVEPKSTSKSLRTKTSAEDNRPSSRTVGYVAIIFMSITIGGLLLLDSLTLLRHIRMAVIKLKHSMISPS